MLADIAFDPLNARLITREVPRNVEEMQQAIRVISVLTGGLHSLRREEVTPELMNVLSKMRHMLLEKPSIRTSIGFGLMAMRLKRQGEARLLAKFIDVSYRFKIALLDALERIDEAYEGEKLEAVTGALEGWKTRSEIDPESVREWLDAVSDRTVG